MKASICRSAWIAVLSALLGACGGGGGGSGGPPPNGPPNNPPPGGPAGPPSVPAVTYQGAIGPADLSSTNAGAMAEAMYASFFIALELSEEVTGTQLGAGQSVDTTEPGPSGGSVHITGTTAADGTGWIAGSFTGYQDGGVTIDGLQVSETLEVQSPANGQRLQRRLSFGDFRLRAPDVDVTYGGTITRIDTGGTSDRTVAGTVLIRENLSGATFYSQNFSVNFVPLSTGEPVITGSARAFDSRYGYVDVESEGPWYLRVDEDFPHHGAPLRGVGRDARYLRLTPLAPDIASIEFVGPGATRPNFAARVRWQENFETQTTRQPLSDPLADGGASRVERPGRVMALDSRFTTHPQTAFVSSQWTLLFRPPGSTATIADPQLPVTQITPDIEGRYVIGLEVNDGVRTDRDVIVLTADSNVSPLFTRVDMQLTPDERAGGGALPIDLTQVQFTGFEEPVPQLTLSGTAPDGLAAQLTQTNPRSATLQLNTSGVYELIWSQASPSLTDSLVRDIKWIAVDAPMPFTPGGAVYLGAGDPHAIASGDLNGDGFADLVVTMRDGSNNAVMHLFYGNAAGMLEPAVTLPVSSAGSIAIGDVSSDGLADIVLTTGLGIGILLQGPQGTFGSELSVPGNCFPGGEERDFALVDVNGDGRRDVVSHGCSGELDYYLQTAAGLQAPERVTTGISAVARLTAGDLNGDGAADVVLSDRGFEGASTVFAIYGVPGGLPGAPVALPYQSSLVHRFASAVAIADMNGDGRPDVISGENPLANGVNFPRLLTFLQQADGTFAAPVFGNAGPAGTLELAVLDLNHDGSIDVATKGSFHGLNAMYGAPFFGVLTADPRPAASLASKYAFPEAVLDLNHDGRLDFAYLTGDGRRVILGVALGWDD